MIVEIFDLQILKRKWRRDLINEILIKEASDLFDMLDEHLFLFDS